MSHFSSPNWHPVNEKDSFRSMLLDIWKSKFILGSKLGGFVPKLWSGVSRYKPQRKKSVKHPRHCAPILVTHYKICYTIMPENKTFHFYKNYSNKKLILCSFSKKNSI